MDVQVEKTGELTRQFTIKVAADEVTADVDKSLEQIRRTHRQRGFRPGKVPMSIIRSRFGASVVQQVTEQIMQRTFNEVVTRHDDIVHVTTPELLTRDIARNGLHYRFNAESLPRLEPKDYVGLKIQRPRVEVDEEELGERLKAIQQENAYDQPVDKAALEDGDIAQVSYRFGEAEEARELTFEVGSARGASEEFHAAVRGKGKGDEVTFEVGDPAEGTTTPCALKVEAILKRVIPAIDDDLAKDDGRAETLEGLKEALRAELSASKQDEADKMAEERLLDALLAANPFELPPGYFEVQLENETKARLQSFFQGMDISKLGINAGQMKEMWRPAIQSAIKRAMLLDAIAVAESIRVEGAEVDARINEVAERQKTEGAARQARQFYRQANNRRMLERELLLQKTTGWLMERAEVEEIPWAEAEDKAVSEALAEPSGEEG